MSRESAAERAGARGVPSATTSPGAEKQQPESGESDRLREKHKHEEEEDGKKSAAGRSEKIRIVKNVVVLGVAFMLNFTAFHGTANLQSSVNSDASLGTFTLASVYGSLILSNIFLPVIVIRYLGCKWAVAFSFIAYMPFIAAQFYPSFYTLIPSGLAVGFGGGPLWCAKCTYLTVAAEAFSNLAGSRLRTEVVMVRFFGLFFVFYQMAQVWGNLISSTVLSMNEPLPLGEDQGLLSLTANYSLVTSQCGAQFCPALPTTTMEMSAAAAAASENPNLTMPDRSKINTLSAIFLGCMVAASLLVAVGVDSLKRYDTGRKGSGSETSGLRLLMVTVRHLTKRYQLLLLPITVFIGAEQAFVNVEFTAAFVACGWGISKIGYVMICFGVVNALGSAFAGALTKLVGQFWVLVGNALVHVSLIVWMIDWRAVPGDGATLCVMAALWGLVDGVWLVQINAASGILFPGHEEAAFSNFRLLESIGSVCFYVISPLLCTRTKLFSLLVGIVLGLSGYSTIEYLERRAKRGKVDERKFELVTSDATVL